MLKRMPKRSRATRAPADGRACARSEREPPRRAPTPTRADASTRDPKCPSSLRSQSHALQTLGTADPAAARSARLMRDPTRL
eukprot:1719436-Pleurochrysis_carterae.AAC.1